MAKRFLREFGFREFRVRHHDQLVRLEIAPAEMDRVLQKRVVEELAKRFRELGFKYVTLDLQGFRSGSMNERFLNRLSQRQITANVKSNLNHYDFRLMERFQWPACIARCTSMIFER